VRVLNVEYRLAEENPFPAALLDALSAYVWLVEELQISPDRIVLSGDSGGGECGGVERVLVLIRMRSQRRAGPDPLPARDGAAAASGQAAPRLGAWARWQRVTMC
jgi:hypothetical protein